MNDNEVFNEIYEAYYKWMLDYAKKRMNEKDAEDVVQNVFLKLMNNLDLLSQIKLVLNDNQRMKSILFICVRNECNSFYRHNKRTNQIFSDIPYIETKIFVDVEQEYQNADMFALLMANINKMDKQNRNIFIKYYIEGYSIQELAKETRLPPRAIEGRLYRMLNFLKKKIKNEEDGRF